MLSLERPALRVPLADDLTSERPVTNHSFNTGDDSAALPVVSSHRIVYRSYFGITGAGITREELFHDIVAGETLGLRLKIHTDSVPQHRALRFGEYPRRLRQIARPWLPMLSRLN